jgi:membrane protease YdiL (CAAX protease family)
MVTHDEAIGLTNTAFFSYLLFSFCIVASYVTSRVRQHAFFGTGAAPPRFSIPASAGWFFIGAVLLLLAAQSILYVLLVVIGTSAFLVHERRTASEQFGFENLPARRLIAWTLLVCGAVIAMELPLSALVDWSMTTIKLPHPEQESVSLFRQAKGAQLITLFLLQAVFIAPVIEEVFFRGFLFTFLKRYMTTGFAVVASAGVFAIAHANVGSILQLWLLACVLGLAYEHTGSLLLPIGIHGLFNLITALNLLLQKGGL